MSAQIRLGEIAHARSGDKGNHANIGVIAYTRDGFEYLGSGRAMLGTPRLVRQAGSDVVDVFADLHRRASGDKGTFMTEPMAEHFRTLEKEAGAVMVVAHQGLAWPTLIKILRD